MLSFIAENLATIIIGAILIAIVASIIVCMVKNKKKGKSSCGCGCANCPMSANCQNNYK